MRNFSLDPNIFLGILINLEVWILYFFRSVRPEVAKDEEIFFATIGFFSSYI